MIVVLTAEAETDLERIGDAIAQHAPRRAESFVAELVDCCQLIGETPEAFPRVPRYEASGVRRRVHGNYLIFYRATADRVEVLHILHGARDDEAVLFPIP